MGLRTLKQKKRNLLATTSGGGGQIENPQNFSTSAQFPSSLAAQRLDQNQQQATRLIGEYPELEGNADVRQIEDQGWLDRSKRAIGGFLQATGLDSALRFIDTPRRLLQLGAMDVFGGDSKYGEEITAGNYWEVLTHQDERLVDRLGADVVGEYGDLSGSVIFDALGWEKTDNFLNNFFRGTTQFIYDAATDPVTYVSFGMSALPKQAALEVAELTVRDAAKAAAKRVVGQLDDVGETALEASMRATIGHQAEVLASTRLEKAILEAGEGVLDGTTKSSLKTKLFSEAVDEVELTVGDSWVTKVGKPIAERDFVSLPEEYINHHAVRNMTADEARAAGLMRESKTAVWTTGGVRFGSPFGKKTFGALPGTRGLGRKITTPVRKAAGEAVDKVAPLYRAQRAAKWLEEGTGYEKFLIGLAKEGKHYGVVSRFHKEAQYLAHEIGDETGRLALRNQFRSIADISGQLSDAEFDDVVRLAFHGSQNGGTIPVERLAHLPAGMAEEVQQAAKIGYDIALRSHEALQKANIRIGQIANFTPMRMVPEFKENLRVWMQDGAPLTIPVHDAEAMTRLASELGNGVTVEDLVIFADVVHHSVPGAAAVEVLGDTTSFHQRTLGRTAVAGIDDSEMVFINEANVLPDGRSVRAAYGTMDDLNDGLMRVFNAIAETKDVAIAYPTRKSTKIGESALPLRALQDDPLHVWNGYLDSIQKAAFEAHLIQRSRELGLVRSPDYGEVLDQTMNLIRPALQETPEIVQRVVAGRANALREMSAYKLPHEAYTLGGVEVQLPKGWRQNRSMRAAVKRYEEQQAKVERTLVEVKKLRREQAAKLMQQVPGMSEDEAMRWAVANSTALAELRGAARQEAMDMAVEVTAATHQALLGLDEAARDAAYKRLGEVEARAAELARAHADAMDELTRKYAEKVGDGLPRSTNYTQLGADGLYDDVATRDAFAAIITNAKATYDAKVRGQARHVQESIAELRERVVEVGSRERLDVGERLRLEHLERLEDVYLEGFGGLEGASRKASQSAAEQLMLDLRDVIDAGFANFAKPRIGKAIEAKMTAYLQDGGTISHYLWDDDQFRELLAVGVRHRDGTEIARGLQKEGKRISGAASMRAAEERVDSFIRAARSRVQAQQDAYRDAARAVSNSQGKGVTAFLAGDMDVAAAYVHEISDFISGATGRKGGLTMVKVASGNNRDRWIVEWVDETVKVGENVPSLADAAKALREGRVTADELAGRNLSEVVWYRDLEDSLNDSLYESALRAARGDVERLGVPSAPHTLEGVAARLSPDGETAKVGDLFGLREIDARASTTPGALSGAERVDRLKQAISAEGWRDTGDAVPVVVYVDDAGNGTVFLGDGNHRVTALHELGMDDQAVRVEFRKLDDPVAVALKQEPVEGVKYLEPTTLDDFLGPRSTSRPASQQSEALRVWNDVFARKIDSALAGKKGAATRLKHAVSQVVNGDVRVSAEWRALERALPVEESAKLKALIRNLVLQDEATTPIERRLLRMNQAEIMHGDSFAPVEATLDRLRQVGAELEQAAREAASLEHRDAIQAAMQLNDTIKRIASRVAETDANGMVKGVPARLAALDAAFREDLALAAKLADELGIDQHTKNVARGLKSVRSATELGVTAKEVSFLRKHFTEVADSAQVRSIREGMAHGTARGLGGTLADVDINPHVAIMFENMTNNMRALHTPLGVTMLQRTGHGAMNLWKSSATIARPAFHLRNFISATWNNMIVGVGMREYTAVHGAANAFRKALKKSASVEDALLAVSPRMRPVVRAAWEDHVLQAGFARAEFRNVPTRNLSVLQKGKRALNPAGDGFALTVAGSSFMTRIEDFHRMAAFYKFYDPAVPQSSSFAREMTMAVHFDYENLTTIERRIKMLSPFFVWSRRNIPLQLRVMVERPGIANRYAHLMDAVRDNAGNEDADAFPVSPWLNSHAAVIGGASREGADFWNNLVFDPDFPIVDLEELPMFGEKGLAGTFSPVEWLNFAVAQMGPHITVPFQLGEQQEYGDVNAPVGLNEVFRALNLIDFWGGIDVSEQGDVQLSYTTRSIFETLLPYYRELTAGFENDPNRQQRLGIPENPSVGDILQGYGTSFGKGLGFQTQAPADAKGPAYEAQQLLRELRERRQKGIG